MEVSPAILSFAACSYSIFCVGATCCQNLEEAIDCLYRVKVEVQNENASGDFVVRWLLAFKFLRWGHLLSEIEGSQRFSIPSSGRSSEWKCQQRFCGSLIARVQIVTLGPPAVRI